MAYRNGGGRTLDSRGEARTYRLQYGSGTRSLATVIPDAQWPGMWRIAWPDGRISDMANLSRAKDAAMAIAERGPPRRDARHLHWKIDARETALEAPWIDWPADDGGVT